MMEQQNPFLKEMLELSRTVLEADEILEEQTGLRSTSSKIAFLKEIFGIETGKRDGVYSETQEYNDYIALLAALIDRKWR